MNIETDEFKISVQREPNVKQVMSMAPAALAAVPAAVAPVAAPAASVAPAAAPAAVAPAEASAPYAALKAPMIGTFYRSSGPDSPLFVQVGDMVEKGQVICIIEAMKLFNEIEAEESGRIVKALVENATPVEFDQPLFLIE